MRKFRSKRKNKPEVITQKDKANYFYAPYRSDFYLENTQNFISGSEKMWGQITEIITNKNSDPYDILMKSIKKHNESKRKQKKSSSSLKSLKRNISSPFLNNYPKKIIDKSQFAAANEIKKIKSFRCLSAMKARKPHFNTTNQLIGVNEDLNLKLET